jgi:hypothetical protein
MDIPTVILVRTFVYTYIEIDIPCIRILHAYIFPFAEMFVYINVM